MFSSSRQGLYSLGVFALILILTMGGHSTAAQSSNPTMVATSSISLPTLRIRDLQIRLIDGGIVKAQFVWPTDAKGPLPTVVLFQRGAGDVGQTLYDHISQPPVTAKMIQILAQQLGDNGIAVLGISSSGANDAHNVDNVQAVKTSADQPVTDSEALLAAALAQPEVDGKRLYVYGWNYDIPIAANLAQRHPELAGLILHSAPSVTIETILTQQLLQEGVPYLGTRIDANDDGKLSLAEVGDLPKKGVITYFTNSLYDASSTPDKPMFNKDIDKNGDGLIDIQQELVPYLKAQIISQGASSPDHQIWQRTSIFVASLKVPVLLLQGMNDGLTSPDNAQRIAAADLDRVTLKLYPRLGHSLAKSASPLDDALFSMEQQPIDDMAAWILAAK